MAAPSLYILRQRSSVGKVQPGEYDDPEHAASNISHPTAAFVMVVGTAAADKSSFIELCCKGAAASLHWDSPRTSVSMRSCYLDSTRTIFFANPPDFGEESVENAPVLYEIAKWLILSQEEGRKLSGIICLQASKDTGLSESYLALQQVLEHLCGLDHFGNVALAMIDWDQIHKTHIRTNKDESNHEVSKHWEKPDPRGATVHYLANHDSIRKLLNEIAERPRITLRLQHQMMHEQKSLDETDAGKYLHKALVRDLRRRQYELRVDREQLKSAAQLGKAEHIQALKWEMAASIESVERLESCIELLKLNVEMLVKKKTGNEATMNDLAYTSRGRLVEKKNGDDRTGETILHFAAKYGDLARVQDELGKHAELEAKDCLGCTALHYAAMQGHVEVVWCLLKQGASTETKNIQGIAPLAGAAHRGHEAILQILLDHRVEIEAKDNSGWTALHCAVQFDHRGVVRLLLNKGANLEARDNTGQSALHLAAMKLDIGIARMLVNAGADVNAKDDQGRTPLSLAQGNSHAEMAALLQPSIAQEVNSKKKDDATSSEMSLPIIVVSSADES